MSDDGLRARQPAAISSALKVLEEVAKRGTGVTAQEISANLGMPRATTYRIVNLLVQDGYLVRMPDLHGFALGRKVVELVHLVAPTGLPPAATAELQRLRGSIRAGVHLVRFDGATVRVVDQDPDFPLIDPEGFESHPHRSAAGRLLVAELTATGERLPAGIEIDAEEAAALVTTTGSVGYAVQVGAFAPGFGCLAVPLRTTDGRLIGSVTVSAPARRVTQPEDLVRRLGDAVPRIARDLAW